MQSANIGNLAKALSLAQGEYNALIKDSSNPFFKSKYADLAACIECVRKPLAAHGLAVVQTTGCDDGPVLLTTTLIHESGEWISGIYPIVPIKADPQGYGAALTYARRYSLSAMLGIAAEDDDGNTASGLGDKAPAPKAALRATVTTAPAPAPAPAAPAPAPQQGAEPGICTVTGLVDGLLSKATKNGTTRYGIKINDRYYNTFDSKVNEVATAARAGGYPVRIDYIEGRYGKDIEQIVPVNRPVGDGIGDPSNDINQDPLPF